MTKREFSLANLQKQNSWIDLRAGRRSAVWAENFALHGFEGIVKLQHSRSLRACRRQRVLKWASALAFLHLAGAGKSRAEIALLCQRAENQFIGVNCGIMDQMAVAACIQDHALLLDCRSLEMEQVPLSLQNHVFVVTDSAAPRELARRLQ
jgi:galactokinase